MLSAGAMGAIGAVGGHGVRRSARPLPAVGPCPGAPAALTAEVPGRPEANRQGASLVGPAPHPLTGWSLVLVRPYGPVGRRARAPS